MPAPCLAAAASAAFAGMLRLAQNPDHFRRCRPGEQDHAHWTFGSP